MEKILLYSDYTQNAKERIEILKQEEKQVRESLVWIIKQLILQLCADFVSKEDTYLSLKPLFKGGFTGLRCHDEEWFDWRLTDFMVDENGSLDFVGTDDELPGEHYFSQTEFGPQYLYEIVAMLTAVAEGVNNGTIEINPKTGKAKFVKPRKNK